jgi:uncharacterized protein (TIGR03437 family)
VNGEDAPLLYAISGQVNAQMPFDVRGPSTLRLTTATGFVETAITVSETAPAIFPAGVWHGTGAPVSSGSPVRPGEALVIYLTGLGQVSGGGVTGQAAPFSPLTSALAPVEVEIGDRLLTPFFAGLTPGFVGVYQVNVMVPADLPPQAYLLRISAKGNLNNTFSVPVQAVQAPRP